MYRLQSEGQICPANNFRTPFREHLLKRRYQIILRRAALTLKNLKTLLFVDYLRLLLELVLYSYKREYCHTLIIYNLFGISMITPSFSSA